MAMALCASLRRGVAAVNTMTGCRYFFSLLFDFPNVPGPRSGVACGSWKDGTFVHNIYTAPP